MSFAVDLDQHLKARFPISLRGDLRGYEGG
jgi:hypothetical protein